MCDFLNRVQVTNFGLKKLYVLLLIPALSEKFNNIQPNKYIYNSPLVEYLVVAGTGSCSNNNSSNSSNDTRSTVFRLGI